MFRQGDAIVRAQVEQVHPHARVQMLEGALSYELPMLPGDPNLSLLLQVAHLVE